MGFIQKIVSMPLMVARPCHSSLWVTFSKQSTTRPSSQPIQEPRRRNSSRPGRCPIKPPVPERCRPCGLAIDYHDGAPYNGYLSTKVLEGLNKKRRPYFAPPSDLPVNSFSLMDVTTMAIADVLTGTFTVKSGHAQMLKGGVIMDVVTPDQAMIAAEAGAVAVMALERVPADIRADGGVARMTDPAIISKIMDAVSIPVMAKVRIGHFVEAQILEALGVDYIDESEVLTPADETHHVWKHDFKVPFVCGCRDLGEALRRISEGAAMIRTKGEAGTGDVVEAVRHMRAVQDAIRKLQTMPDDELVVEARDLRVSLELLQETRQQGRLPVVNFAAGGVATPADAALMMQLGADGVFVGSGIFKSGDPASRAYAIVQAVTHYNDPQILAEVSKDLGEPMVGRNVREIPEAELLAPRSV